MRYELFEYIKWKPFTSMNEQDDHWAVILLFTSWNKNVIEFFKTTRTRAESKIEINIYLSFRILNIDF
ncbi:MAG: hypothetical protein HN417_09950 [Desulfobacula sp.]|nr:hypothetical protein [Desulfobacula sp.]